MTICVADYTSGLNSDELRSEVWPCRLFGSTHPCLIHASKFSETPISSAENPCQTDLNSKLIILSYQMDFWRTTASRTSSLMVFLRRTKPFTTSSHLASRLNRT